MEQSDGTVIEPIVEDLTASVLADIVLDDVIYADVAWPGAMGLPGAIRCYVQMHDRASMICYETSIFSDEETYQAVIRVLEGHSNIQGAAAEGATIHFGYCYGGMGNHVFIKSLCDLERKDGYFIYRMGDLRFRISPSARGVWDRAALWLSMRRFIVRVRDKKNPPEWIDGPAGSARGYIDPMMLGNEAP